MSGDWMKVELELPDKPEVFRIASILNLDPDAVVGKLLRVWAWFDKHTESGNADSVTFALVDRISGVTGFGEAMAFAGWLVQEAHSLSVPNFDRHNGKTAKNRALTAKRVANSKKKSNAEGNAPIVTTALPREEKRREEEEKDSQPPVAASAIADCPHAEIVALYHEILPSLAVVKSWSDERKAMLRKRWREESKRQTLDYWRQFFSHVSQSPFLMGNAPPDRNGHVFVADLEWLIRPTNFIKVIEGKYHDRRA